MPKQKFVFLEHTADVKFQAFGKTIEECFENCALAMIASQYKGKIKAIKKKKKIKVKGKDNESLLYNFLEGILFLVDSKRFLVSKVKVKMKESGKEKILEAELFGDDIKNYKISWDVKAITYNEMFVRKEKNKYTAQVVIDV